MKYKEQNGEMHAPVISVIVPVYNVARTLEKCVRSILNQTCQEFELILIDDGSTDASGEMCDQFATEDDRVRVMHIANGGSVEARMAGLRVAVGEYVGFADADDYMEERMLEVLLQHIRQYQADFVHMGFVEERTSGSTVVKKFQTGNYENQELRARTLFLCHNVLSTGKSHSITPSLWSKLFKRELIVRCFSKLPKEQQYGEDFLCLCRCILESSRIVLCDEALYHYVIQESSLSHVQGNARMQKEIGLYYHLMELLREYGCLTDTEDVVCRFFEKRMVGLLEEIHGYQYHLPRFSFADMSLLRGKKIILYGAGGVGQDYYNEICKYSDCQIVAWTDGNWKNCSLAYTDVVDIAEALEQPSDCIVIAVADEKVAEEIKCSLIGRGVPEERLIWREPKRAFVD